MNLALEIPFEHLDEISQWTDFDYALAHIALQEGPESTYVKFYQEQARKGRIVWLDNGAHELGESLPLDQIVAAGLLIQATHIVAPEVKNNFVKTRARIIECETHVRKHGLPFKIVGPWHGYKKDAHQLLELCDEVALPFDRPRGSIVTPETSRMFHYFGFRSLDELRRLPPKSLDTSMPIRAALYGIDLTTRSKRPPTPLLDFRTKLTLKQLEHVKNNVTLLRGAATIRA